VTLFVALGALDDLANRMRVRVAYYVRPQHTALEAAWRQWGFRSGLSPSAFLDKRLNSLRYHHTYVHVTEAAPGVEFTMCPFHRDLLIGGDAVVDFAGENRLPFDCRFELGRSLRYPVLELVILLALVVVAFGLPFAAEQKAPLTGERGGAQK
jgi:hypothetical protein